MALPRSQSDTHSESPTTGELQSWASEAPLRLVSAALHTMPERTGKPGDIRQVLEGWVELKPKWGGWWNQLRPMLAKSEYFERGKANRITALGAPEAIPAKPLPAGSRGRQSKATTVKSPSKKTPPKLERDWQEWLQGKACAAPRRGLLREAQNALNKIAAASPVAPVLERVTGAAEEILASDKPRQQAVAGWAELLSKVAARWQSDPGAYVDDGRPAQVGALMARLVAAAGFPPESGLWLCRAGALHEKQPAVWRKGFAAGMWQTIGSSPSGSHRWLRSSFRRSTYRDKTAIVQETALAALAANGYAVRYGQIDGLLENLTPPDRLEFLQNLVVRSAAGAAPKQAVLDYITRTPYSAESPHTAQDLTLLTLAALLLSDGPAEISNRAAQRIGELLANPPPYADNPVWDALLSDGRQRVAALNTRLSHEMERQRRHYEERLAECQRESERQRRQAQRLRAELEAGREASKLDIRQDMLTVMSETLQSLRQSPDSPEQTLRNVAAGLSLAMRAGDAAEFGTVGDIVPYDPTRHQANQAIPLNAAVRITHPGAVVPGKLTGDRVILKAQVVHPAEVDQ